MTNPTEPIDPKPIATCRDPRVRWLALAIVILSLVVGGGSILIVNFVQTNHQNRVNDQQRTDDEIGSILTCILHSKKQGDTAACLRNFVQKHPASTHSSRTPSPSAPRTTSGQPGADGPSSSTVPGVKPSSSHTSAPTKVMTVAPRSTARATPTARPAPTTQRPTPTPSSSSPKPLITVGRICLPGLLGVPPTCLT